MKLIAIATVGESNKVVYDAAGNRYFVPAPQRANVKAGLFAIVNTKTFTSRTKTNEAGEIENDDKGNPILEACEPWTREDLTFVGDKKACIETKAASRLLEAEEDAYVAQQTKALVAQYSEEALKMA